MKAISRNTPKLAIAILAAIGLAACSPGVQNTQSSGPLDSDIGIIDSTSYAKVSVAATSTTGTNQTQVEESNFRSVVVNVNRIELVASRGNHDGRIVIAEDVGPVDLMTLNSLGIPLALGQANLIGDTTIHQIRLVLHESGHRIRLSSGETCEPKTPSQQQSGLKIILPGGLKLSGQSTYTFTTEFDPYHSIVLQPHGRCLLKPVIKSKCSVHRGQTMEKGKKKDHSPLCAVTENPNNPNEEPEDPVDNEDPTEGDPNDTGDSNDGDTGNTDPNDTDDSGDGSNSSGGSTDSGDGSELPVEDGSDSNPDDGTDEPPVFNPDNWNILF